MSETKTGKSAFPFFISIVRAVVKGILSIRSVNLTKELNGKDGYRVTVFLHKEK